MQASLQESGTSFPSKAVSKHMHVQEGFTNLITVAGSTLNATQKVCAMVTAFVPEAEAKNLQSDITAGGLGSQQSSNCDQVHRRIV